MSAIPATFTHDDCRALQMALNEKNRCRLTVDGDIGPASIVQLKIYQSAQRLAVTGEFDDATSAVLLPFMRRKYLWQDDYQHAAALLAIEEAVVMAAVQVEAGGDGFLPDGRAEILFERHKFYQAVAKKYGDARARQIQADHPTICNPQSGGYIGHEGEYSRLAVARGIDYECAISSCSWGMFQILGSNFAVAGYASVDAFVGAMQDSERNQLSAWGAFVRNEPQALQALRVKDWTTYAKIYNGPGYLKYKYDTRMATAYAQCKQLLGG